MKFLRIDSPIYTLLTRIVNIVLLNVLWVLCSIPIVTMGAATAALYYTMLKINRDEDTLITEMFFRAFRQNLKQGSGLTILFVVSGVLLYADYNIYKSMEGTMSSIALAGLVLLVVVWGMIFSYAFPLLAQFDNTMIQTLKNAFFLSVINFKKTIIIFVMNAIPFVIFLKFPYAFVMYLPIFLTIGFSFIAYINSKLFIKVFRGYIGEE